MRAIVLFVALLAACGCRLIEPGHSGRSPLVPLSAADDSVTLEIFSAPAPLADPNIAALWNEVDEQQLPADLRRNLGANGVRAGVVGPNVPAALAELLKVTDNRVSTEERSMVPLTDEPGPILRVQQFRAGKRQDLVVAPARDEISLLRCRDGQVNGRSYRKAEGRLLLRVVKQPDGRLQMELQPELQHGEVKANVTGSANDGMFIWKPERSRLLFPDLKLSVALSAGQMFVVGCTGDKPLSLGHWLFAQEGAEKPMQKLWVMRVAQAAPDRSFLELPAENPHELIEDDSSE